jgi:DNA-binding response OmpR family regulator
VFNLLWIGEENEAAAELRSGLAKSGFACLTCDIDEAATQMAKQSPDLVLVEITGRSRVRELSEQIKPGKHPPIIALIHRELLDSVDGHLNGADDFIVKPCNLRELELRIKRLLHEATDADSNELIGCGDLIIDVARCQVTLDGQPIELTFREYELLKFLVSNGGRVYTREALLNKVWGYDYYGGDRTVDVHIRRLRSKIEDSKHKFIETVRNIGYRLRDDW